MWPKMLLQLLPHFARLMPMADKYLSTRGASDKAQEAALATLAAEVRGQLGTTTDASAGLRRQIQEQSTLIADLAADVKRARISGESVEARVAKLETAMVAMEKRAGAAVRLLGATLALLIAACGLLGVLVMRVTR